MKKKYTGREWSENRFSRFQVGLIIALLLVFYAFQYESVRPIYTEGSGIFVDEPIEQIASVMVKTKTLPKQVVQSTDFSTEIEETPLEFVEPEMVSTDPTNESTYSDDVSTYKYERATQLPLPQESDPIVDEIMSNEPITFAEQMPLHETCVSLYDNYQEQLQCTTSEIMKVIRKYLDYPAIARENGIEGTVTGSFVVNTQGEITQIEIQRGAGFGLDEAVVEVFQKIPNLLPGMQNKREVNVKMLVPVKFKLAD